MSWVWFLELEVVGTVSGNNYIRSVSQAFFYKVIYRFRSVSVRYFFPESNYYIHLVCHGASFQVFIMKASA